MEPRCQSRLRRLPYHIQSSGCCPTWAESIPDRRLRSGPKSSTSCLSTRGHFVRSHHRRVTTARITPHHLGLTHFRAALDRRRLERRSPSLRCSTPPSISVSISKFSQSTVTSLLVRRFLAVTRLSETPKMKTRPDLTRDSSAPQTAEIWIRLSPKPTSDPTCADKGPIGSHAHPSQAFNLQRSSADSRASTTCRTLTGSKSRGI